MNVKKELKKRMEKDSGFLVTAYPSLYHEIISKMIEPFRNIKIDKIFSPEMKGMFFGPTMAYKMNLPFVSILKKGRVPEKYVISKTYKDYSEKEKTIQIAKRTIKRGQRILLVDDVFDSGESGKAAIKLIEKLGGKVVGISIVYNRLNKKREEFFKKYNFHYLLKLKHLK